MRVAVVGSRRLCIDIAPYISPETTEIITCKVPGVCMLASAYADDHGLPKLIIKTEYMRFFKFWMMWQGEMAIDAAEMVVVIWDGRSKGPQRAIAYAREVGKPVHVHIIDSK